MFIICTTYYTKELTKIIIMKRKQLRWWDLNPRKYSSQSAVPYRLATPHYFIYLLHILYVKSFCKIAYFLSYLLNLFFLLIWWGFEPHK